MVTEEFVLQAVQTCNGDRQKTFAEFLAVVFKDKFIELYLGDSYEEISLEQTSTSYPAVFVGKVVGAYRECLIISSAYTYHKTSMLGNLMFINERAIRALNEVDGKGVLEDMFLRSRESLDVKSQFANKNDDE